jgi:hypothetical protein
MGRGRDCGREGERERKRREERGKGRERKRGRKGDDGDLRTLSESGRRIRVNTYPSHTTISESRRVPVAAPVGDTLCLSACLSAV